MQDDESGLVYMRARYYEPGTGRFFSEDFARDGWNAYCYCGGDPVNYCDASGKWRVIGNRDWFDECFRNGCLCYFGAVALALLSIKTPGKLSRAIGTGSAIGLICVAAAYFDQALGETNMSLKSLAHAIFDCNAFLLIATAIAASVGASRYVGGFGMATVITAGLYSTMLLGALVGVYDPGESGG